MPLGTESLALATRLVAENLGDYCYDQMQQGLQGFDECMREGERSAQQGVWISMLVIGALIGGAYLYNRGKEDQKRSQLNAIRSRREEMKDELARIHRMESQQGVLPGTTFMQQGYMVQGIPLPPRTASPLDYGSKPAGWYRHPSRYDLKYWDGDDWVEHTDLSLWPGLIRLYE